MEKILGLNTSFESLKYPGFDEKCFSTSVSLLDYEIVVIDMGHLASCYTSNESFQNKRLLSEYYSHQILKDFSVKKEQIIELLKHGRTLFLLMGRNENCCIYTGEKKFNGTGKNAIQTNIVRELNMYSFLPIEIQATHVTGESIDICCKPPYSDFLKQTYDICYYASYFTIDKKNTTLAKIKGTDKIIASVVPYEKGRIICLPYPYYKEDYTKVEYWRKNGKQYLDNIIELNEKLTISNDSISLPKWANEFYILDERKELEKQSKIEEKINKLNIQLSKQKTYIENIQKYKLLLTASGAQLEEITKKVLCELGFELLDAEKGRSDIIAKYNSSIIVAEIKGVSKSAAEKHAAQLEKWSSQYIEDHGVIPKPLLIVNGFCDIPINIRVEEVFPHQMLKYCEARGHALITTSQLLCLYIECQLNPACKDDRLKDLLSCVGKYEHYKNICDYFDIEDKTLVSDIVTT